MSEKGIHLAQQWLSEADAILVTASNGFAISEGLNLFTDNPQMRAALGTARETYRLPNLLTAFQYPYPSLLDKWATLAPVVQYYSGNYEDSEVMIQLKALLKEKPYFIWTSNTEHHFVQAGFERVLEVEGNWTEGRCENGHIVDFMNDIQNISDKVNSGTLTEADIPKCEHCGAVVDFNLPSPQFEVDQKKMTDFQTFIQQYKGKNLVVLELGIGAHNQLIKAPSMQLVESHRNHRYITINKGEVYIKASIKQQSIGMDGLLTHSLDELLTGESVGSRVSAPEINEPSEKKMIKKVYPSYTVTQGNQYSGIPRYVTIDSQNPSHFHLNQQGQSVMYTLGDTTLAHCITANGEYQLVRIGLNKSKGDLHGLYIELGTYVAFERDPEGEAGFSQISINTAFDSDGKIMMPTYDQLSQAFPEHQALFDRLAMK
ncbi:Sir2 silent information regulator family NAD-dependent deacetylase [Staphylococcus muscae]|uniref:SIR2 family protein n=1 Tax=Staphylococcus muscae TaxID=1294 RepID=A0A240C502_9STAP|nr:Sir2 silent information regulator family NAD-dependent deacetylase [Staphylococcus muscae]AVQ33407.1 Sir2 silent information regulator family NAD-dependent deacetylase [Staphylococcus muscae]PNZ04307.1 Sir2 silent information regulator family NAD-dependent deacetylase [Staphylococcus muscae]GGA89913.1 hypothetical protein GCM10007183_12690 [Staphylococcus muscae]SNW03191.1 SIR2 family protein [Staphylococcus muscae]